jgi:WD40 repeat protein
MTCEWAEGNLSAYLDDALDPQLRKDVGAHIESCAHCQALADEYRRNDQLLATLAPVEPADLLRQRIFESPTFVALAQKLERETAAAPPGRVAPRRAPLAVRALIPLAALLTLSLGAALLFKQGLLPFGANSTVQRQTNTIGGPGSFDLPLSAGPRLVFLNGAALWSVAEYAPNSVTNAPGAPQRLTPTSAHVVAWAASPQGAANHDGGARIAYVDGLTGALHIVHSDGQADTIVGSVSPTQSPGADLWTSPAGHAALTSLTWSPDGSQLAYIAATADGATQARIVSLNDGATLSAGASFEAPIGQLAWSADSHALAFTTISSGTTTVIVWRSGHGVVTTPADANVSQATVAQFGWSGSTLSWATTRGGAIVGVYALPGNSATPNQLTATGARYEAADFTSAHGGAWLLASNGALSEARLASGGVNWVANTGATASHIAWSPKGATAALIIGGKLVIWSGGSGQATLAQGVTGQPIWSPSGAQLAVTEGQNVMIYRISNAAATQVERLSGADSVLALAWATDERNLAILESHGMLLVTTDGVSQTLLTSRQADGDALSWSVAR